MDPADPAACKAVLAELAESAVMTSDGDKPKPDSTSVAPGMQAKQEAGTSSDAANPDDEAPDVLAALAAEGLPSTAEMKRITQRANEAKLAARLVSDGSLRLHLCLMLRAAPVVTWALVSGVGGDRYFNAYLPALGCECVLAMRCCCCM